MLYQLSYLALAPPITLEVLTKHMTAVLNNAVKDNPDLMLDTLWDTAIAVGLSSAPFVKTQDIKGP